MSTGEPILLLGATGNLGKHVLASLHAAKCSQVTLLVRSPEKLPADVPKNYKIIKGEISDADVLKDALVGASSVIMTAGRPDVVDEPGKAPGSLRTLFRLVYDAVLASKNPPRLLALGGLGILDAPGSGFVYQLPFFPAVGKGYTVIHDANLALLRASNLEWTFFCPGLMVEDDKRSVAVTFEHAPFFDPTSSAGILLSYLPSVFSTAAMGVYKNIQVMSYRKVADVIVDVALKAPSPAGRPLADFNHKRVGFYSVS